MSLILNKSRLILVLALLFFTSCSQEKRHTSQAKSSLVTSNSAALHSPGDTGNVELGLIRGNRRTRIYHWPGCPNYDEIAEHNRVPFETREEAERAGYRAARNCH